MNPIYIEKCGQENFYKLDLPYYHINSKHTVLLCNVKEGYDRAKTIAIGHLFNHINDTFNFEVKHK
jgi:hypothetical protein